jgi:hypothetical protein
MSWDGIYSKDRNYPEFEVVQKLKQIENIKVSLLEGVILC